MGIIYFLFNDMKQSRLIFQNLRAPDFHGDKSYNFIRVLSIF